MPSPFCDFAAPAASARPPDVAMRPACWAGGASWLRPAAYQTTRHTSCRMEAAPSPAVAAPRQRERRRAADIAGPFTCWTTTPSRRLPSCRGDDPRSVGRLPAVFVGSAGQSPAPSRTICSGLGGRCPFLRPPPVPQAPRVRRQQWHAALRMRGAAVLRASARMRGRVGCRSTPPTLRARMMADLAAAGKGEGCPRARRKTDTGAA